MRLTGIAVFLFMAFGGLEWIRTRIWVATSVRRDEQDGERVFDAIFRQSLASG